MLSGEMQSFVSDEKIRVRWLSPDKPGNISVGRQRIAAHLRDDGFEVEVVGTTFSTVLDAVKRRDEYEVIIGTTRAGAIAGTVIGRLFGKPVVVDHVDPIRQFQETHGKLLSRIVQYLENISFFLSDSALYVYDEEYDRISRYAGTVTKTDLGVDYDRFADPDPEILAAARDHLDELQLRDNIAIYVGGLEPIYHLEELLEAMEYLPEWSLIIAGDGSQSDLIESAATEQANVHYLGVVPHETVPGCLHAANVGVCLVDDPHTLKVLEYGAAGLPVIQAEGRAEKRFGEHLIYTKLSGQMIAEAITRAQDTDGLQNYVEKFCWRDISNTYAEKLTSVMKSNS